MSKKLKKKWASEPNLLDATDAEKLNWKKFTPRRIAFASNRHHSHVMIAFRQTDWDGGFGEVVEGWDTVKSVYGGYRDTPSQARMHNEGYKYLRQEFPKMDYIDTCVETSRVAVPPETIESESETESETESTESAVYTNKKRAIMSE